MAQGDQRANEEQPDPKPPQVIDRTVFGLGFGLLVLVVVVAASIVQDALRDPFARALFAFGLVAIVAGLVSALAHVAGSFKIATKTTTTTTRTMPLETPTDDPNSKRPAWDPGTVIPAIGQVVKETVTALTNTPTWIAMMVIGTLLLLVSSLFDGYDGFGIEVTTPKDQETAQASTATSIAFTATAENQVLLNAQTAAVGTTEAGESAAQGTTEASRTATADLFKASQTAEAIAFERELQRLSLGIIPDGYVIGSPIAFPTDTPAPASTPTPSPSPTAVPSVTASPVQLSQETPGATPTP